MSGRQFSCNIPQKKWTCATMRRLDKKQTLGTFVLKKNAETFLVVAYWKDHSTEKLKLQCSWNCVIENQEDFFVRFKAIHYNWEDKNRTVAWPEDIYGKDLFGHVWSTTDSGTSLNISECLNISEV